MVAGRRSLVEKEVGRREGRRGETRGVGETARSSERERARTREIERQRQRDRDRAQHSMCSTRHVGRTGTVFDGRARTLEVEQTEP